MSAIQDNMWMETTYATPRHPCVRKQQGDAALGPSEVALICVMHTFFMNLLLTFTSPVLPGVLVTICCNACAKECSRALWVVVPAQAHMRY